MRRLLRDEETSRPISDINMTNLVDVTLTLLILFILIAPVIDQGFSLELPEAEQRPIRTLDSLTLVIDQAGRVLLEGRSVTLAQLETKALTVAARDEGCDVVILADHRLDYGRVVQVMDTVRRSGLTRLSLATTEGDGGS